MDHITWWSGDQIYPKSVSSTGGRHITKDSTDAPDTQVVHFEFEDFTAVWEHRRYGANNSEKHPLGIYFYGTKGTFHMGWRDGWTFFPAQERQSGSLLKIGGRLSGEQNHEQPGMAVATGSA